MSEKQVIKPEEEKAQVGQLAVQLTPAAASQRAQLVMAAFIPKLVDVKNIKLPTDWAPFFEYVKEVFKRPEPQKLTPEKIVSGYSERLGYEEGAEEKSQVLYYKSLTRDVSWLNVSFSVSRGVYSPAIKFDAKSIAESLKAPFEKVGKAVVSAVNELYSDTKKDKVPIVLPDQIDRTNAQAFAEKLTAELKAKGLQVKIELDPSLNKLYVISELKHKANVGFKDSDA